MEVVKLSSFQRSEVFFGMVDEAEDADEDTTRARNSDANTAMKEENIRDDDEVILMNGNIYVREIIFCKRFCTV